MFFWTDPIMVRRFGALESVGGLVALNTFPGALYLVTIYAEPLTLALVVVGFVALCKDRWLASALAVGAATGCRPTAVAFSLAFGVGALARAAHRRKAGERRFWRELLFVPLSGWGLGATMFFYGIRFHDALLYNHARALFGDRPSLRRLFNPVLYVNGLASREYDIVVLGGLVVLVILGAAPALRRCRPEERAYLVVGTLASVVMALSNATERWGLNRYFLLALLAFFAAGQVLRRAPVLFLAWTAFGLTLYWHVAVCNYVTQGDTRACPMCGPRDGISLPLGS